MSLRLFSIQCFSHFEDLLATVSLATLRSITGITMKRPKSKLH